jgi:nickel-dependent lactate racemase
MKIKLAYGKTGLEVDLPTGADVTVIEPKYTHGLKDPQHALSDALRSPTGTVPLRSLARSGDTVGIVFSDLTRPTPNHLMLPAILSELDHLPGNKITLFNATGTHRPNTEAELRGMLGDEVVDRYRIVQNDALDDDSHVLVGTTSRGNEVWVLREFVESDLRIATGFIEPHFFAGFSGGGKAVMPGLALLETVLRNHSVQHIDSPKACWGITEGNPLWEEVREAAHMVEPVFLLNVALNRDKEITAVFAGDLDQAHAEGCGLVKEQAMVAVDKPFDIVITSNSGYPLDLNLYQTVKGMSAAAQIVRDGGAIIAAAECWDGIPAHGEYGQMLIEAESPEDLLQTVRAPGYLRQDMWQTQIQALISSKADVYLYADGLTDKQISDALLTPCRSIGSTVQDLLDRYGPQASICVLPEGPQTIPYVSEA